MALRWALSCAIGRLGDGLQAGSPARLQGLSEPQVSPTLAVVWGQGDASVGSWKA